eukprot:2314960-Rhodomonas_salina.1
MTTLQVLMLNSNKIEKIPENVADLGFLTVLHMDNNGIKEIPYGSLGLVTNLQELSLQRNKIKYIPGLVPVALGVSGRAEVLSYAYFIRRDGTALLCRIDCVTVSHRYVRH